jgi:alpha-ketoglutarate-dependent taurine dioxygenase
MSEVSARIANLPAGKLQLLLREMAKKKSGATEQKITPRPRASASYPLSFAQQRLWFLDQLDPGNHIYNEPSAIRLAGALNPSALARSFDEIIRRHEVLRTTFSTQEGEPVQVIAPHLKLQLSLVDLSELADDAHEAETERLAIAEALRPFDLSSAPFMRVTLVRKSAADHVLLLTMHHIISDAWSTGILIRELMTLYVAYADGRTSPLAKLSVQYADYAVWQRKWLNDKELERQLAYWRKELSGAPPVMNLPFDRPRPAIKSYRGGNYCFTLPAALTASLRALSRSEEVTVFNTLLAALQTLLYRLTAQDDIVIGANIANRNHAGTESLIGFFINMLALRADLAGDPSFRELLGRARNVTLGAYAHQDLPFDKLIEELQPERIPGISPLFQVVFNYYAPEPFQQIPGLKLEPLSFDYEISRFDLSLIMSDRDGALSGVWKYSTELFDANTIARIHGQFETLLQSITAQPDARLSTLEIFTRAEQQQRLTVNKELKKANFKKFVGVKPKTITASTRSLVRSRSLSPGERVPLVVEPEVEDVDLSSWAADNRAWIDAQLLENGAILFRHFNVDSAAAFHQLARAVSGELLDYVEPSSPRSEVGNKIYTSTEYPADQWIFLHNEMSYALHWPRKVFFYCVQPAALGGETPLACSRTVFDLIDPAIREQFIARKVMYVRNFGDGLHRPWQEFFKTQERAEVEAYCLKAGIEPEWLGANRLRIRQVCQSVARHPETGALVWFNQAHAFHVSSLDPAVRSVLLSEMDEADIPRNAYYGDGTAIDYEAIAAIQEAYRRATIAFPWQARDVLLIDNMAVAHGRAPFSGPREVLVAMAEPHSDQVTTVNQAN